MDIVRGDAVTSLMADVQTGVGSGFLEQPSLTAAGVSDAGYNTSGILTRKRELAATLTWHQKIPLTHHGRKTEE
jgi:hypothetical protein